MSKLLMKSKKSIWAHRSVFSSSASSGHRRMRPSELQPSLLLERKLWRPDERLSMEDCQRPGDQ